MVNPLDNSSPIIRIQNDDLKIRKPADFSVKQVNMNEQLGEKTDSLRLNNSDASREPLHLESYNLTKAFKKLFGMLNLEGKIPYNPLELENIKEELQLQHKAIIKFCDPKFDILRNILNKYGEDQQMHQFIVNILTSSSQDEGEIIKFITLLSQLLMEKKDKELSKELNLNITNNLKTDKKESGLVKILSLIEENIEEFLSEVEKENLEEALKSLSIGQSLKDPLLHFFLPLQYKDMQAESEIWIEVEDDKENNRGKKIHLFITLEIDEVGTYEVDLYQMDKKLDIKIYAQKNLKDKINTADLINIIKKTGVDVNFLRIEELKEKNKLEKIFSKGIFIRRNIDAKA